MVKPGIPEIRLVTEVETIQPGGTITVGLFIRHDEDFHTYWKGPGVVGVPTGITWKLPKGFSAGPLQWPGPERTKMAKLTAYGYEQDVCLLTEIKVPKDLNSDTVTIEGKATWMACARTCHPGFGELSITLPVSAETPKVDKQWAEVFNKSRKLFPSDCPQSWDWSANRLSPDRLELVLYADREIAEAEKLYFFCYDNQVHSDEPQTLRVSNEGRTIHIGLARTDFGPESPKALAGVLYHPNGWGPEKSNWIEVEVPWEK